MTKSEVVEHLKNSTVKIDNASRVGTGFFIAEKLIATCYHNIKGHSKDELRVYWQEEDYGVKSIEINQDDDLALLEIKIDKKHPVLQIDKSMEVGDDCQSFGYSRKNGDVITFEHEGKDGDGHLKFKKGLFQSGLSGAAVLNFRTHKICGIVKSKRDNTESVALGGRGIPISKLLKFLKSKNYEIDDNGSIFSKEMFKNWVWTSSVDSADKLQFSVLALIETLVAVGLSFFVWIYYGFYWHIFMGLLVAPLVFLRTEKSILEGLLIFNKIMGRNGLIFISLLSFILAIVITLENIIILSLDIFLGILLGMFLLILFLIKIYSMLKNLSLKSIKNIPINWFKLILSIDIMHPPELIASIEKTDNFLGFTKILTSLINNKPFSGKPIDVFLNNFGGIFFLSANTFLFFPSLIFRYSLKSTAWIYLPLIWLIEPQDKQNLTTRLKLESKNFIAYLMFFYSLIVVFVFTLLPLLFPDMYLQMFTTLPHTLKVIFFAYPPNFENFNWILYTTRLFSALITIVFMFSFTKILIRRESEPSYGDFWGTKLLSLRSIRSFLTLVTLGFTAYHILGLLPSDFFSDLWLNMKFS